VEALPAVTVPFSFCSTHETDRLLSSAAASHFRVVCNTTLILHSTNIPGKSTVKLLLGCTLLPAAIKSLGMLYNHTEHACFIGRLMQALQSFSKPFKQTDAYLPNSFQITTLQYNLKQICDFANTTVQKSIL
jgi:hypothetical protein